MKETPSHIPILIRGAGEMATGVAHRLGRCGFRVLMAEIEKPLAIRRGVAFAEAIYEGAHTVEDIEGRCIQHVSEAGEEWEQGRIPVIVDPELQESASLMDASQSILIDARMLKTRVAGDDPPCRGIIALGPGFRAPEDARFVIETNRGHHLGRVIEQGSAEANTGIPAEIQGASSARVLYAPQDGVFHAFKTIGDIVRAGDKIGSVNGLPVMLSLSGVLRGILHDGLTVSMRTKIGDIDPRGDAGSCFLISDKARAIAGGVLEAVLRIQNE